jgi:hypothetical protein
LIAFNKKSALHNEVLGYEGCEFSKEEFDEELNIGVWKPLRLEMISDLMRRMPT